MEHGANLVVSLNVTLAQCKVALLLPRDPSFQCNLYSGPFTSRSSASQIADTINCRLKIFGKKTPESSEKQNLNFLGRATIYITFTLYSVLQVT